MANPVVITRSVSQAQALAACLRAAGRQVELFPLLEILPLEDDGAIRAALARLEQYALIAFVSPNAIDAAFAVRPQWPQGLRIAVMGEGSRLALARHGITSENATVISPIDRERTDSETLLQQLDLAALRGQQVLIIRGESGRELLGDALRAAGVQVEQVAAYRRAVPVLDGERSQLLGRLLAARADWVVTSSEALRNLIAMAQAAQGQAGVARALQQRLVVPHIRIEETARALGFERIERSASGDESLVVKLQLLQ